MANLRTASATDALNDEDYINKIYDSIGAKQQGILNDHYTDNLADLNTEKENVRKQTGVNLGRTEVEAQKAHQSYKPQNVSSAVDQQAALTLENQKRKNVSDLLGAQSEAEAEIERQRLLMGQQYSAAIKQAQANNDMARAQQLYMAAKEQDARFRTLKANAATLMTSVEDNSILESIINGLQRPASSGATWGEVLKHEDRINEVYDNAIEADRQQAQMEVDAVLSKIRADQEAMARKTDQSLTETYVKALQQGKNYNEVQNAYGLGSGNKAQAQLARATGLTGDLTELRGVQMRADANSGMQRVGAMKNYRDTIMRSVAANDKKRAEALYGAAADEEASLIAQQQAVGKALADQGDFSVLGKLYGLTDDQTAKLNAAWAEQEAAKKAAEEEARRKAEEEARKKAEAEAAKKKETEDKKDKNEAEDKKEKNETVTNPVPPVAPPQSEQKEYYTDWENEKLQDMANSGINKFEENRTPLTEEQKKELTTEGARDEMFYIKNSLAEARRAEEEAAVAAERKAREAERRALEEYRRAIEEEEARQKAIAAAAKKNPGSSKKPATMKQFDA